MAPRVFFLLENYRLRVSIVCALCLCLHGEFARRDVGASNIPFGFFIYIIVEDNIKGRVLNSDG